MIYTILTKAVQLSADSFKNIFGEASLCILFNSNMNVKGFFSAFFLLVILILEVPITKAEAYHLKTPLLYS